MIDAAEIARARSVRIEDELARRGVKLRGTVERNGPCPVCGGRDRFSINVRKQIWNCRGCSKGGDVIAFVQHLDGIAFTDAIEMLSGEKIERPQVRPQERLAPKLVSDNSSIALNIWKEAADPRGTVVETYLAHRGLILPDETGAAIRFHPACPFKPGCRTRAIVALVRDIITNEPKAIHRTALTAEGMKAWIDGNDRLGLGPVAGGAVKLTPDADVTLWRWTSGGCGLTSTWLGYRIGASWLMNSATAGVVRKLKSKTEELYLWQPAIAAGQPPSLLGYPVAFDETMPDIGANTFPIAFGDFRKGYLIVDRIGVRVLRDPFTNKPYVHFYTTKRVGGGPLDTNAIKLLKIATS